MRGELGLQAEWFTSNYFPPALAAGLRSELLRGWIEVQNVRVSSGVGNVPEPALSHRNGSRG
jgi:hypothetical protein